MRRRDFLTRSGMAAGMLALPNVGRAATNKHPKQLLELRVYHFASPQKQQVFADFLEKAGVAGFNRAGARPVGVFKLLTADNPDLKLTADSTDLYVLLPHASAESFTSFSDQLGSDKAVQQGAQAINSAPKSDPVYLRFESNLMRPFPLFSEVKVPTPAPGRLLQLRIYESHNQERARKKIEMFNQGGELGIFARTGMTGVFFGQSLAGTKLPNLIYMLGFPSEEAQKKAWDTFRNDDEWKRLSKEDQYKDAVSNVTNLILRPLAGSQV